MALSIVVGVVVALVVVVVVVGEKAAVHSDSRAKNLDGGGASLRVSICKMGLMTWQGAAHGFRRNLQFGADPQFS